MHHLAQVIVDIAHQKRAVLGDALKPVGVIVDVGIETVARAVVRNYVPRGVIGERAGDRTAHTDVPDPGRTPKLGILLDDRAALFVDGLFTSRRSKAGSRLALNGCD